MTRRKSAPFDDRWIGIPESGCWLWTGTQNPTGYGEIRDKETRRKCLAHRVSWERVNGQIPEGLFVLHKCDVKLCVNPQHLFLGTHSDNMADWVAKGARRASAKTNKVTYEDAQEIIASSDSASVLSKKYGISMWAISAIRNGRSWKHQRTYLRGESSPVSKLKEYQVLQILENKTTERAAAAEYGVARALIHAIRKRKIWKHISPICPSGQQSTTESVNVP